MTAFTCGASAGASYAFSERLSLDGTVKALWLEDTSLTTSGTITIVSVGLKLRF